MKRKVIWALKMLTVAFVVFFASTNLFAQSPVHVPVSPPASAMSRPPTSRTAQLRSLIAQPPRVAGCYSARATMVLTSSALTASACRPIVMLT